MTAHLTPDRLRSDFAAARITPDLLRRVRDLGPTGVITADLAQRTYRAASSATLDLTGTHITVIAYDHETVMTDLLLAGARTRDAETAWPLACDRATAAALAGTDDWLLPVFLSPLAWRMRRTMREHGFELAARPALTPDEFLVDTYIHTEAPTLRVTLAMPAFTDGAVECEATVLDRYRNPVAGASGHLCHDCGAVEGAAGLRDLVQDTASQDR